GLTTGVRQTSRGFRKSRRVICDPVPHADGRGFGSWGAGGAGSFCAITTVEREGDKAMAEEIALNSIKLKYVSIEEAKSMTGLRLILGAYAVPGPWREACKGIFYVKKIP